MPDVLNFSFVTIDVWQTFLGTGDMYEWLLVFKLKANITHGFFRAQQAYLLYEPLLKAGYRLLRMHFLYPHLRR